MASKIPYIVQPGVITKVLQKAKEAKTPDRFTYDFLETKLGCKGGSYKQFVSLAKRLSLLKSDGTPTELYKKFRNASTSKAAIAQAIKNGYKEIFDRNESANTLDREKLKGLVVEVTGLEANSRVVQLICQTFETLKSFADFSATISSPSAEEIESDIQGKDTGEELRDFDLSLCYSINLVLPKTDDPAVFNAIFRSLRDNLLRK
jgi:hypothetical protein